MLFNSIEFIFAFLPVVLLFYYWLVRRHHTLALSWLVLASLFFYGWWNPVYLVLIVGSMGFNLILAKRIYTVTNKRIKKRLFVSGIIANLGLLGYFKYAGFFVSTINLAAQTSIPVPHIILPLAISFFTFQQIAFLFDLYQGNIQDLDPLAYFLFISFFPQLIAGPIVHHREMMPQFSRQGLKPFQWDHMYLGVTYFAIGLFKKVMIADNIAPYANQVFQAAGQGMSLSFFESWGGALAYTCQLYFDFSGYADMAIGAAWLFGIQLPINFNSPYKATSIAQFWRCWHITLGRFLKECLYIPLGGNQYGAYKTMRNLMITMILGGLWHGAGFTFILWGLLHGVYLVINALWRQMRGSVLKASWINSHFYQGACWFLTFISVVFAWVLFRAESLSEAAQIYQGMLGFEGILLPTKLSSLLVHLPGSSHFKYFAYGGVGVFGSLWGMVMIFLALSAAFMLPNSVNYMTGQATRLIWRPQWRHAIVMAAILFLAIKAVIWSPDSEFLYFNF